MKRRIDHSVAEQSVNKKPRIDERERNYLEVLPPDLFRIVRDKLLTPPWQLSLDLAIRNPVAPDYCLDREWLPEILSYGPKVANFFLDAGLITYRDNALLVYASYYGDLSNVLRVLPVSGSVSVRSFCISVLMAIFGNRREMLSFFLFSRFARELSGMGCLCTAIIAGNAEIFDILVPLFDLTDSRLQEKLVECCFSWARLDMYEHLVNCGYITPVIEAKIVDQIVYHDHLPPLTDWDPDSPYTQPLCAMLPEDATRAEIADCSRWRDFFAKVTVPVISFISSDPRSYYAYVAIYFPRMNKTLGSEFTPADALSMKAFKSTNHWQILVMMALNAKVWELSAQQKKELIVRAMIYNSEDVFLRLLAEGAQPGEHVNEVCWSNENSLLKYIDFGARPSSATLIDMMLGSRRCFSFNAKWELFNIIANKCNLHAGLNLLRAYVIYSVRHGFLDTALMEDMISRYRIAKERKEDYSVVIHQKRILAAILAAYIAGDLECLILPYIGELESDGNITWFTASAVYNTVYEFKRCSNYLSRSPSVKAPLERWPQSDNAYISTVISLAKKIRDLGLNRRDHLNMYISTQIYVFTLRSYNVTFPVDREMKEAIEKLGYPVPWSM